MYLKLFKRTHSTSVAYRHWITVMLAACLMIGLAGAAVAQDAAGGETATVSAPLTVNVNLDDALTMSDLLAGIGPARADAIVEFREANGQFSVPEDLLAVSGIGPATLDGIRDQLTFSVPE